MQRLIVSAVASTMLLAALATWGGRPTAAPAEADRSSAERGKVLISDIGCGLCHSIPGIDRATGNVGPPLSGIGSRIYIAGVLNNTPENMVRWLRFPQKVVPGNAMPDMGLSEDQARDIAAYLRSIE